VDIVLVERPFDDDRWESSFSVDKDIVARRRWGRRFPELRAEHGCRWIVRIWSENPLGIDESTLAKIDPRRQTWFPLETGKVQAPNWRGNRWQINPVLADQE